MLVSLLAESLTLAVLGGLAGGLLTYLGFNGYQTSTMNFQTFSQVAFAFAVTPSLLTQGLTYALVMGFGRQALAGHPCRAAAHPVGAQGALAVRNSTSR